MSNHSINLKDIGTSCCGSVHWHEQLTFGNAETNEHWSSNIRYFARVPSSLTLDGHGACHTDRPERRL